MKTELIISAAAIALALGACSKKPTAELDTYTVSATSMSEVVTATGTMESVTSVDVGTQVTGIVDKLYVDYNDQVTKGQLMAEIDKTLFNSELESANASLQSAKITYEYNKRNYERDLALHKENLISDYEFQTTQKDYQVAKMNYEKMQADRIKASTNLNYTQIYAPIDGIVVSREVEVGQTVVSSMNVANLYVIADLDHMQVIGNVDEADIGQVKAGQHVTFTVDAYPEDTFDGKVQQVRISPTTTNNVVTYEVVVSTENPDHKLLPGMTANLSIYTLELNDILAVPLKALKFNPEFGAGEDSKGLPKMEALSSPVKNSVWVLHGDKLVETAVEVGMANNVYQQITGGLKAGDKVALQVTEAVQGKSKQEENPFMPKPPGARNNKGNAKK